MSTTAMEILIWVAGVVATFIIMEHRFKNFDDVPVIVLSSIYWPVAVPALVAAYLYKRAERVGSP